TFEALDDVQTSPALAQFWFGTQLLQLGGHAPNLEIDEAGNRLAADRQYDFSFDHMSFAVSPHGRYGASHIKFLRLSFGGHHPKTLAQVQGSAALLKVLAP